MSSGETDNDQPEEHRLLEYDTTVPVARRVRCACGWETLEGSGKTALGAWYAHLASHGVA